MRRSSTRNIDVYGTLTKRWSKVHHRTYWGCVAKECKYIKECEYRERERERMWEKEGSPCGSEAFSGLTGPTWMAMFCKVWTPAGVFWSRITLLAFWTWKTLERYAQGQEIVPSMTLQHPISAASDEEAVVSECPHYAEPTHVSIARRLMGFVISLTK